MKIRFQKNMKYELFFTADTHFGHENIIRYCNRPFSDVDEMDETMISNWNNKVGKSDIVVHAGDFSFKPPEPYLNRLNGKVILVFGSHDKSSQRVKDKFYETCDLLDLEIAINKKSILIVVCHYPMRIWNGSHFNSIHLFGHSHGRTEPVGKSWDVGVDNNNFAPVSFAEVMRIMKIDQITRIS